MNANRAIISSLLVLVGILLLFESTPLDLYIQDYFYDFNNHRWLVDRSAFVPKLIFYRLPKYALVIFGVVLIGCLSVPADRRKDGFPSRRQAAFLLLCLVLIPSLIALGKKYSGVFCPSQTIRYGGSMPCCHIFNPLPACAASGKKGRCFPAGHASGGFALMGLYFVAGGRRAKWLGWGIGFSLGWIMGLYQMLKGAHYLSHTLATMMIAWTVILILSRLLQPLRK